MYLAIDVGASKTLLAAFSKEGQIIAQEKIATSKRIENFLQSVKPILTEWRQDYTFISAGIAFPGFVNRTKNTVTEIPNLHEWNLKKLNKSLRNLAGCPFVIENDANTGALAEARLGAGKDIQRMLYVTIGTGVGTGLAVSNQLDPYFADFEGGHLLLKSRPQPVTIEYCISGPAMKRRFGKFGYELVGTKYWNRYAEDLAITLVNFAKIYKPDAIVLGGGVSVHFEKFIKPLRHCLAKISGTPEFEPKIIKAEFVETAVIYGCYLLAREIKQT